MKNLILSLTIAILITGCINSSTNFSNRGVTYQVTPENIGEHSAVTGSPTANDSIVNASKDYDTKANISGTGQVNDTSTNNQESPTEKPEEKSTEDIKK